MAEGGTASSETRPRPRAGAGGRAGELTLLRADLAAQSLQLDRLAAEVRARRRRLGVLRRGFDREERGARDAWASVEHLGREAVIAARRIASRAREGRRECRRLERARSAQGERIGLLEEAVRASRRLERSQRRALARMRRD